MCGIAGAIALDPGKLVDADRVAEISRLIAHRGPDDSGIWRAPSGRAVLAHRRLEIIDLRTGQQPMMSEANRVGLVFNGEIYNYRELREQLIEKGARFYSASDTEVILRLFEICGSEAVNSLRGMFAFAIWDDEAATLTLVRDRLGKKPLFYCVDDGCLYFSSTMDSLRITDKRSRPVSPLAIDAFLQLGYIPAPWTACEGIHKLEAGSITSARCGSAEVESSRFWDLKQSEAFQGSYEDATDRLDGLLNESVALRLRSDVALGVFLSGGVDSSLVAAIAARHYGRSLQTFSIGFDVDRFDESGYARQVAELIGTDHHEFRAHPDLMGLLPKLVRHFGEPFGDSSALPVWLLAQRAREYVKVAVGGDGGDESFAGYDWYRSALRIARLARVLPKNVLGLAARHASGLQSSTEPGWMGRLGRALAVLSEESDARRFARLRCYFGDAEMESLYDGELRAVAGERRDPARRLLEELYDSASGSRLRRMQYVDIRSYLADDLLPKVDVATMAHGLEARAPLLDHEVVEFALSLPAAWLSDGRAGKRILRDVLGRYLPRQLFERPKQGFTLPLGQWFAGGLRPLLAKLESSPALLDARWFRATGIRRLVAEHLAGHRDHSQRLYFLLVLDEWLRR